MCNDVVTIYFIQQQVQKLRQVDISITVWVNFKILKRNLSYYSCSNEETNTLDLSQIFYFAQVREERNT